MASLWSSASLVGARVGKQQVLNKEGRSECCSRHKGGLPTKGHPPLRCVSHLTPAVVYPLGSGGYSRTTPQPEGEHSAVSPPWLFPARVPKSTLQSLAPASVPDLFCYFLPTTLFPEPGPEAFVPASLGSRTARASALPTASILAILRGSAHLSPPQKGLHPASTK